MSSLNMQNLLFKLSLITLYHFTGRGIDIVSLQDLQDSITKMQSAKGTTHIVKK